MRPGRLQQDVQEPTNHEDASQDALHKQYCDSQGWHRNAAYLDVRFFEGWPEQKNSVAMPQMQENLRRSLRASAPLRSQALRGREAFWVSQMREEILCGGTIRSSIKP